MYLKIGFEKEFMKCQLFKIRKKKIKFFQAENFYYSLRAEQINLFKFIHMYLISMYKVPYRSEAGSREFRDNQIRSLRDR